MPLLGKEKKKKEKKEGVKKEMEQKAGYACLMHVQVGEELAKLH